MEEKVITFTANEQGLVKTGGISHYASDTISYIKAVFTLGENWQGFDEVRAVFKSPYKCKNAVLNSVGECIVPFETLMYKGDVRVNLVGSIYTEEEIVDRLTTYSVKALTIDEDVPVCGDASTPLTPSEYEQFVAKVANDANRAEAGAESAEASAQNASESASASAVSASDSARSATASAESAQDASDIAVEVEVMKNEVELAKDKVLGMRATAETLEAGSDATASYSDGLLTLGIPRGDRGEQGIQGETGATPNLTIGTVETLEPTEDATATITGTAENPVLNLGIPQGKTGEVTYEDLESILPRDTASGQIASFPDGQSVIPMHSLKVLLEPIQDLHGYDKPWVGGAGKNKLNISSDIVDRTVFGIDVKVNRDSEGNCISIVLNGTASTRAYITLGRYDFKAGTILSGCPAGGVTSTFSLTVDGTPIADRGNGYTITEDVDNGNLMIVIGAGYACDNLTFKPMIRLASETDATFAPYSNICPISGHTECVTEVCGVNVWDEEWEVGTINNTTGLPSPDANNIRAKNYRPCKPNTSYFFYSESGKILRLYWYDAEQNYISTDTANNTIKASPDNAYYFKVRTTGYYGNTYNHDISINYPSTDTDYHAYQGTTYTTDLGRTVYGGTLDVVSGELVVDRAMVTYDGTAQIDGMEYAISGYNRFFIQNDDVKKYSDYRTHMFANLCPTAINYTSLLGADDYMGVTAYNIASIPNNYIYIVHKTISSVADLKTFLAENPLQICYELATPQTIQLTPQEVQLLLGTNNIWSDGKVTLTYSADIQRWVEKKLNGNSTTLTMSRPMTEETE